MVNEKEIIKKTGIVFKPNNTPDPKEFHPAIIILQSVSNRNVVYYLTLTSQTLRYVSEAGATGTQYYFLVNSELPKPSLVNLDYIYKSENVNDLRMMTIDTITYQHIVRDLKKRQKFLSTTARGADEYYDEVKEGLHR